jgi:putative membrane protein
MAGAIAICAMILPGISGSFLLLVMGLYAPLIEAVKSLHLLYIGSFALGAGSGILMFSHVLGWLFEHYRTATFATLFGFIIASLPHVWPWKTVSPTGHPLDAEAITPWAYSAVSGQSSQLWLVLLLAVVGWFLVLYMAKQQPKNA